MLEIKCGEIAIEIAAIDKAALSPHGALAFGSFADVDSCKADVLKIYPDTLLWKAAAE
jgi:hypothetical protein